MKTSPIRSVLVISKRSAYDYYVRRFRMARVRALIASRDPVVAQLARADRHHEQTLAEVRVALQKLGVRARFRDRSRVGGVEGYDLVITVGGDGTLLSASHAIGDTPMLGVNSAPKDSVGYLTGAKRGNVARALAGIVAGTVRPVRLARMRVTVDGRVVQNRVLNDVLFAHQNPAMTSRYFLVFRRRREEHKSSGVWIGPATGSTAAIHSSGGVVMPPRSQRLQFRVREPYEPHGARAEWLHGFVAPGEAIEIWNKMREAAIYIDGPRIEVPLEIGERVRFDLSPEPLWVFGARRG